MAATTLRQRLPIETVDAKHDSAPSSSSSDSGDDTYYTDLPMYTPPSFTIKDVLGAIPAECFERSALKSSQYVVQDFAMIGALMYAASHIEPALGSNGQVLNGWTGFAAKWAAWSVYWVLAGFNFTGVWIIGKLHLLNAFSSANALGR